MEGFTDIFETMIVFMDFIPNKKSITNLYLKSCHRVISPSNVHIETHNKGFTY